MSRVEPSGRRTRKIVPAPWTVASTVAPSMVRPVPSTMFIVLVSGLGRGSSIAHTGESVRLHDIVQPRAETPHPGHLEFFTQGSRVVIYIEDRWLVNKVDRTITEAASIQLINSGKSALLAGERHLNILVSESALIFHAALESFS